MSLNTGRQAIEEYILSNWDTDAIPIGLDGHTFEVTTDNTPCIRMTITEGAAIQGSIGQVANIMHHIGMVTFQIFTDGGLGSVAWRGIAQDILDLFHGKTLTATGAVVATASDVAHVRFSPPIGANAHPYIGAQQEDAPFYQVNVICPFIRYETR